MVGIAPEPMVQEARPAGQITVLTGVSMQKFMEDDSMHITFVHPNSGLSMQELIDFDSMPVAFVQPNKTHSGPVLDHQISHAINPGLMQLPAAATTIGFAPKSEVQEAGSGTNASRPGIGMQEFIDVDSMPSAHDAAHGYAPRTMQVSPPAATCSHDPLCSGPAVPFESAPSPLRMIPPWGPKDADMLKAQAQPHEAQPHALQMHKAAINDEDDDDDDSDAHSPIGLWDDQPRSEAEHEQQIWTREFLG